VSCTVAWPTGSPTRNRSPGRSRRRRPEQRSRGCRGCNPRRYWPLGWPGGRRCRWGGPARGSRVGRRPIAQRRAAP
jgi:hypothetical protein